MSSPIVSTDWLAAHYNDPSIKVLEISAQRGTEAEYAKKHIPGAINFWWKDLCWHETDREFVTPRQLAQRLGEIGISHKDCVVIYGDPVQYGTYAFWALTMAGHPDLRILDGGRTKWMKEKLSTEKHTPDFKPVEYKTQNSNESMRIGRENIREHLGNKNRFLLDVRSPEEYSGERVMEYGQFDHGAERGGRIPSAKHLFFRELLNENDSFKSAEELKEIFDEVGVNSTKFNEIVVYCRLSHRASLAWTIMTHILGYNNVRIYDGSWTEWGSIVGFPVEK